jgi:hypothetical protein
LLAYLTELKAALNGLPRPLLDAATRCEAGDRRACNEVMRLCRAQPAVCAGIRERLGPSGAQ